MCKFYLISLCDARVKKNPFIYIVRFLRIIIAARGTSRVIAFRRCPSRRRLLIRFSFARNNEVEAAAVNRLASWSARFDFPRKSQSATRERGKVTARRNFRNIIVYRVSPDRIRLAIRSDRVHCKQISSPTRGEAD